MEAFDLDRFVAAQNQDGVYDRAVDELRAGCKQTHWMWFVFPQIAGLGQSAMSKRYAIASLDEATAYLAHPVLGPRLLDCTRLVAEIHDRTAAEIFGSIDAQKLQSSMTLFMRAQPPELLFARVLDRHFAGRADRATDERI
jgi:uncharacterized protein (DUF1810 family)